MAKTTYRFNLGETSIEVDIHLNHPETTRLIEAMAVGAKAAGGTVIAVTIETKEAML